MWETANTSFSPRGNLSRWGACALWQQGCVPWVGWEDGGRVDTTELREAGLEQKHKQTQPAQFWSCGIKILDSLMALCWQEFQGFAAGLLATGMHLIGVFFISNAWSATLLPIECFTVFRYFVLFVQNYIARIKNTESWMIFRCNYSAFKHLSKTCMKSSWYHSEINLISTYLIHFALISM